MIGKLHHLVPTCKQVWYADDSTAAGSIGDLRKWWDEISMRFYNLGPVGGIKGQHLTLSTRWLSHDFGGNFSYAIEPRGPCCSQDFMAQEDLKD